MTYFWQNPTGTLQGNPKFLDSLLSLFQPQARPKLVEERACTPSKLPKSTEARAWLRDNENAHPFASERFSKSEAAAMVGAVYKSGASRVAVSGIYKEPWRIARECGPYAATLMVTPKKGKQKVVLAALKRYDPDELGARGGKIRAWWD